MNDMFDFNTLEIESVIDDQTEFIPLLSSEDEDKINAADTPEIIPILPLRNTVLFPGVVIPITVGRDKSLKLVSEANKKDKIIGVVSQKDSTIEDPNPVDLNSIGTVARIIRQLKMPDGSNTIIIQGLKRFEIKEIIETDPYLKAQVTVFESKKVEVNKEFKALIGSLKDLALQIIKSSPHIPSEASFAIKNIESHSFLINFISSNMNADVVYKQKLLEEIDLKKRAELLLEHLSEDLQMLELKNKIQSKVKGDLDQQQREYFLNQQIKTIQEELGGPGSDKEIQEIKKRAENKKWSKEVQEKFQKEIDKLQRLNPAAAEYSVQMNYVELLVELPWGHFSKDKFDLKRAQKVLDRDHYGMDDIKQRILEYLAVLKLKGDMKSPILCLYGPPGVGKTSLGKSVAKALGRNYVRMALGGLRDEAEIRGHRRTYIGAMPGRILQNINKAKTSNPVFVLDEIDKVGTDYHGDPSSALLEVLDPEQNNSFYDNYIELGYDLSNVMFIATANSLSTIQPALRDRMEIIDITGYTIEEKVEIARKHLVPKQLEFNGVKNSQLKFNKKVLEKIVESYTRESGVRGLEKQLAKTIRHIAMKITMDTEYNPELSIADITKILGPEKIQLDKYQGNDIPGVVTGLAWTSAGGDILFIETSLSKGKGNLTLTGNLGNVMKESATIALEFIKAHTNKFGIKTDQLEKHNIHIHVPEGATPKDGPSAGITILTALVSILTNRKVKAKLAMTGEITLRGRVLPVGGIKEKILAAKRANIKEIILCKENRKDIEDIKADYIKDLTFHYVDTMSDVIEKALLKKR